MLAGVLMGWLMLVGGGAGPARPAPRFVAPRAQANAPRAEVTAPRLGAKALHAQVFAPPEADAWLGEDKLKHFLVSFAATSFAASAARASGLDHAAALAVGAGLGVAAGIGKEVRDRATGGDVSARDLVADGLGVAAGTVLAAQTR